TVKRERIDNFSGTLTRTETENGHMEYEESDLDQMKREEALKGEKGLRGEKSPKEVNSPKGENDPAPAWRKGLAFGIAFAVLVIPIAILLLLGVDGLNRWKWILLAVEILLAVTIFFMLQLGTFRTYVENKRIKQDEYTDEEPWEVYFREEEEYENQESGAGSNDYRLRKRGDIFENEYKFKESNFNEYDSQEYGSDEMQTVLLSARPIYKECRRLIPLNGDPEIPINYFPFIIGKNKDLTDYCLNKPGVSRLHVKLEETADGYAVTDLNSTNGTMVAGVLLEANETVPLAPGSELTIAAERYRFQ
ncbi:MAG: FHA domain-containing protein, partial [Lachnospiraceae bacterium]|nr:FHA domain-containing protein [Lachnospiraceae bacterium]